MQNFELTTETQKILEFRPTWTGYLKVQLAIVAGLVIVTLTMKMLVPGIAENWPFSLWAMYPVMILMSIFMSTTMNTHIAQSAKIVIDDEIITGPARRKRCSILLKDIARGKTESASWLARVFGTLKVYSVQGETVTIDVLSLGRAQAAEIYARIGCDLPDLPVGALLDKLSARIDANRETVIHSLAMLIAGAWLFFLITEAAQLVKSPFLSYIVGVACGIGLCVCFSLIQGLKSPEKPQTNQPIKLEELPSEPNE